MSFESLDPASYQPGQPVVGPGGFAEKVKNNLDYLHGQIGSLGNLDIPNGSFEIESNADDIPDGWTRNLYPGGSGGFDVLTPAHGSAAYFFTHPGGAGNGGGYLESDYVGCSEVTPEILGLIHWASAAGMKNEVRVRFFDKAKVEVGGSETVLYTSTENPTAPTPLLLGFTPPTGARYYKVRLVGGYSDTDAAGTAYFDAMTRSPSFRLAGLTHDEMSGSTTSDEWVDVDSAELEFPYSHNLPTRLLVPATVVGDRDSEVGTLYPGEVRLRVGSVYSQTISGLGDIPSNGVLTILLPEGTFVTGAGKKTITVHLQVNSNSNISFSAAATVPANATIGSI